MTDVGQSVPPMDGVAHGAASAEMLRRVSGEIGELLTTARTEQGVSIHEVSARLKVSAAKLEAIEAGNLSALPDMTFAKAIIRSYAKHLGLDVNGLLERLRQHEPISTVGLRHEGGIGESFDDHGGTRRLAIDPRVWVLAGLALLAVAVVYFVMQTEGRRVGEVAESGNVASQVAVDTTPVLASAVAASTAGAPVQMASEPLVSTVVSPLVAAEGGLAIASRPVVAAAGASLAASVAAPSVLDSEAAPLRLRFSEECWVEVRDRNGKLIASQLGRAGGELAVGGAAPLRVLIGNVRGVESAEFRGGIIQVRAPEGANVARLTLP